MATAFENACRRVAPRRGGAAAGDSGVEVTARCGSAWTVAVLYAVAALASTYVWVSR